MCGRSPDYSMLNYSILILTTYRWRLRVALVGGMYATRVVAFARPPHLHHCRRYRHADCSIPSGVSEFHYSTSDNKEPAPARQGKLLVRHQNGRHHDQTPYLFLRSKLWDHFVLRFRRENCSQRIPAFVHGKHWHQSYDEKSEATDDRCMDSLYRGAYPWRV